MPSRFHGITASRKAPGGSRPSCWPMKSDSLGINPDQIDAQMAADKGHGIYIEYDRETGQAVIPDAKTFKKVCVANGIHHRNAGYNDATPDDVHRHEKKTDEAAVEKGELDAAELYDDAGAEALAALVGEEA